jgi:dTDP-4-amino-4,6-dideoxygalactose transaminase
MWKDIWQLFFEGKWLHGDEIENFEEEFAAYLNVDCAVTAPSARAGLEMILKSAGLPAKARVAVPAYTADCISAVINACGFQTIFVDIDLQDHNISVEDLERTAKQGLDAAIITHLFGRPCRMDSIMSLASQHGFRIIEDFSHSIGAAWQGRKVGSLGSAGFCTFSSTKYFNTLGGGMMTTNDAELGARLKAFSRALPPPTNMRLARAAAIAKIIDILTSPPLFPTIVFPAQRLLALLSSDLLNLYNPSLHKYKEPKGAANQYSNMQAHLGRKWLSRIDSDNSKRVKNALMLESLLSPEITCLQNAPGCEAIYWLYIVVVKNPVAVSRLLLRQGIDTGKFFMGNCASTKFVNTETAVRHTLQIPLFPEMDESTVFRIANAMNNAYSAL